jgi:hypothetical protein
MKKQKLILNELNIKSFSTELDREAYTTIKGGSESFIACIISLSIVASAISAVISYATNKPDTNANDPIRTMVHCSNLPNCTKLGCGPANPQG